MVPPPPAVAAEPGAAVAAAAPRRPTDGSKVGTLDNPCSAEKAEGAAPADTPGVSDTEIRIGVISDRKNDLVPVPTIGVEEATEAFVAFCNDSGGINGRKLVLKKYDSQILRTEEVTKQACADNLFALVGDGGVQDQTGITTRVDCGLPEVAAYSATSERSISDLFFQGVPGTQPDKFNVGPCKYMAKRFPQAVKKAGDDVHGRRGVVAPRPGHHRGLRDGRLRVRGRDRVGRSARRTSRRRSPR